MIIANIKSAELNSYFNVHPRFKQAFEGALELLEKNVEDGKYEIDGENIFASISSYETKTHDQAKMETHKDYIDIQLILEGKEMIGFDTIDKLECITPYTPDIAFFAMNDEYDKIIFGKGEFAIIFPDEAHAPCMAATGTPEKVRKMVVKVLA